MDDARVATAQNGRAADGRLPGKRGRATRQRLLEETRALLTEVPFRDLKVVDISRAAGTSPATFYQYFPDVEAAVLSLVEDMVDNGSDELRSLVTDPDWRRIEAPAALAEGFLTFFDDHAAILRVIDLATIEGDERFRALRIRLLNGVFLALQELAERAEAAGRLAPGVAPGAAAGILTTMLAHVSAHQSGFASWGVERGELSETMATLLGWTVGVGSRS
ncbi:MAG: TetR family transcriptional regulator [Acidimicrobiales bacterium]